MALYNEILVGRWNRALQKMFSMKGGPPSPQISSEIQPNITLTLGPDALNPQGWDLYGARVSQAPVAAAFGQLRLRNPLTSNTVVVITKVRSINVGAAADQPFMSIGAGLGDLATLPAFATQRFDARSRPNPSSIISVTTAGAAFAGTIYDQVALPLNSFADFIIDTIHAFPLLPGDSLTVGGNVANQQLIAHIWWMERFLEDSERT